MRIGQSATKLKRLPGVAFKRPSHGVAPTDTLTKKLVMVVQQAYTKPFSLQSDFARSNAFFVAAAASMGLITTRTGPKSHLYGPLWRATRAGLNYLEKE